VNLARRRRILDSATHGQRLLCGYYFYWDDVTNGGHRQYFGNYTGNLWPEALEATRVLRLPEEKILRAAVALSWPCNPITAPPWRTWRWRSANWENNEMVPVCCEREAASGRRPFYSRRPTLR
jgi:hypothetical protein